MNSIRSKMMLVIVVIIVITVGSLGYFNYQDSETLAISILKKNNYAELKNISDYYFEKLIDDMEHVAEVWAESEEIINYEQAKGQPKIVSAIPDNFADVFQQWNGLTRSSLDIAWIYYALESDGSIFISPIDKTMPSEYDARSRDWYKSALMGKGKVIWTEPYMDAGNSRKILQTISKAVYKDEKLKGVIGLDIELQKFTEIINGLKYSQKSEIYLLNNQNKILAHNLQSDSVINYSVLNQRSNKATSELIQIKEDKYVLSVVPLKINGWRLVGISKTQIDSELEQIRSRILVIMIFMSLIALFIAMQLSNNILKPLNALMEKTKSISSGSFNLKTDVHSKNEFGALSNSFDKLLFELNENYVSTVKVLANAIEASDEYTRGHCDRVGRISSHIAEQLVLSNEQYENLKFACILHDVGKIGIPSEILNKPEKLTMQEFELIKTHPVIGYEMIKDVKFLNEAADILLQHHERIDGRGYPNGLLDQDIRIEAKILCVADAYDAMTSVRVYRKSPLTKEQVKEELIKNKGIQLDADLVDIMIKLLEHGHLFE